MIGYGKPMNRRTFLSTAAMAAMEPAVAQIQPAKSLNLKITGLPTFVTYMGGLNWVLCKVSTEYSPREDAWVQDLCRGGPVIRGGFAELPDRPGFGVELDEEAPPPDRRPHLSVGFGSDPRSGYQVPNSTFEVRK
jgi:L-alanine-DL-glutamate epimerase-like enolase superfamily enzyme